MNAVEQLLSPVLEVQSALVGTDGPGAREARARDQALATADRDARRDALAAQGDQKADAAGAGFDAPTIAELDNWRAWELQEMHALLDGINQDGIAATGSDWQALGKQITDSFETFRREVTSAVAETWTGAAAAAADGYCAAFAEWGTAFGAAVDGTGTRIHQAAAAVDLAKVNLPEAQDFNWQRLLVVAAEGALIGGVVGAVAGAVVAGPAGALAGAALGAAAGGAVGGGGDMAVQFAEHEQARQRAAEVMDRYYSGGYVEVDSTTPAFAAAVSSAHPGSGGGTTASSFAGVPGGGSASGLPGVATGVTTGVGNGVPGGLPFGRGPVTGLGPTGGAARPGSRGAAGAGGRGLGHGVPGGAGGRAQGDDDDEERLTKYVQKEDTGLFSADAPCAKPIIGG
ncbi:hypothetical protein [Actinokineospora iranica]|uniref:PPE family protein n=1 Tax=Actinokineospora iranica TaxID=1271860 RepID=A0A1G6XNC7_9PSEU|nr:hypothetical protein [Actinokineospora iranica]SDD79263.1 hypothetical protein SAMN05216174_11826 [Actinokineospora iranica]